MRLAIVYDIPMALNRATAEIVLLTRKRTPPEQQRRDTGTEDSDGKRDRRCGAAISDPDRRHRRHQCAFRHPRRRRLRRRSNSPIVRTADFATIDDAIRVAIIEATTVRPRSTVLAVAGPVDGDEIPLTNCPWVVRPRGMRATTGISRSGRAQRFRGAGAGRGGARRGAYGKDRAAATPEAGASRVVLGPGHRARRRRPDPRLRPLDPGARRRRPHGHRPAHAARFRDLSASRDDRRPHFGRADPVRPRPGQHLSRRRQGGRRSTPRFTTPAEITGGGAGEHATRSPRRRWRCSSPASARTAGDLALVFKSRGGVFLTGGIAQKIVPALKRAEFPRRLRGQGAAQRADALDAGLCHHPSAGRAGRACRLRAPARRLRRRNQGPALVVAIMQRRPAYSRARHRQNPCDAAKRGRNGAAARPPGLARLRTRT